MKVKLERLSTNKTSSIENRTDLYSFTSQKDIVKFFSDTFTKKYIRKIIKTQKEGFIPRPDTSKEINRMQFLKKCEWELIRLAKEKVLGNQNS